MIYGENLSILKWVTSSEASLFNDERSTTIPEMGVGKKPFRSAQHP
jgi:hypothetical protein